MHLPETKRRSTIEKQRKRRSEPSDREDPTWGRVQASRVTGQRGLWGCDCNTRLCPSEPRGMRDLANIHFQRARLTRINLVRMNFKDLLKCLCCYRSSQHWIMFSRNGPQVGTWIIFHFGRESGGNKFGLHGNFLKILLNSLYTYDIHQTLPEPV